MKNIAIPLVSMLAFCLMLFIVLNLLFPLPHPKPYSLVVEDRHGQVLQAFLAPDGAWRLRTHPAEIPARLKKILIRKEDRFFYYHPGINPVSVLRALVQNIRHGRRASGASTITMQVARMLEPKDRTYGHKLVEMFRALQLEMHYSKDEILEMYLSIAPMGGNVEGLKSAALMYYQTPPERLNIAQLFDLILIPNNPNALRPDRHPEELMKERERRAKPWIRRGSLTKQDSIILWQTPPVAVRRQPPHVAPHFCERVRRLYPDDDEIVSSLDLGIQRKLESQVAAHVLPWRQEGVVNAAAIVLGNGTREVLAYTGSPDFDDPSSHGQVDAADILRSPGSTLKPFLFAMEMDRGTLTPKTRLLDTPYDAEGFYAENYDGKYSGLVYADEALRKSLNVPMIRLLRQAGVSPFVDFAVNAGIFSLKPEQPRLGLSLIVGGCSVTLEELTNAYASFPASGIFAPITFKRASKAVASEQREVFSPSAAYMVTQILSSLDRPDLPNNFESCLNLPKVAFKTGTSYGRRDAWSIGYSAEYTIGVWMGNVSNAGNPELTGGRAAAPLLIDVFNAISRRNENSILPMPADVLTRDVCAISGLLPTDRCERTIEDLYSVRHTLDRYCTIDKEAFVSPDGKTRYCPSCIGSHSYHTITYQDYPSELLHFWDKIGIAHASLPPHNAECTRVFDGAGPRIVNPLDAMTYYLMSPTQLLTLEASSGVDVAAHNWYIDNLFIKHQPVSEKLAVPLSPGPHTISCTDDKGRTSTIKIRVQLMTGGTN